MSGEGITSTNNGIKTRAADDMQKQKVDINILLNRVRADKKKEKFGNIVLVSLVSIVVLLTGIIVSL